MKKKILLFGSIVSSLVVNGQVTSINENFNTSCASASGFPSGWTYFNPVVGTSPKGAWSCSPTDGRDGTGGLECTGTYDGVYHLDTSLLITPRLDLTGYTDGNIYLQFDTKTTFISGARLSVIVTARDSSFSAISSDTMPSIAPIINPIDSVQWTTHQADLTPFKGEILYVAFLYTSADTYGTEWFLDNVFTTPILLKIDNPDSDQLPLGIIGKATTSEMKLSYFAPEAGPYKISVLDIMGRVLYNQTINADRGYATYTISGLNASPGALLVRMGNSCSFGSVKAIVQ